MNQHYPNRSSHRLKRTIVAAMIGVSMICSPVVASAQWVTMDIPTLIKEFALDTIIKMLIQKMQERVQDSIVNWSNDPNAFNGTPSFVTNPKDLLSGAEADAANIFFNHLQSAGICSAFLPEITLELSSFNIGLDTYIKGNTSNVTGTTCTLDDLIPSGDIDNYFSRSGFVSDGGYAPMMRSLTSIDDDLDTLKAQAKAKLEQERAKAAEDHKEEVDRGGGFFSQKRCDQYDTDGRTCLHYTIQTPGLNVGQTIQENLTQPLDDLTNSHEFSDFIVAVLSNLVSNAISQGLRP